MTFKLGRQKSAPDIRQLKLARYLIPGLLPPPPASLDMTVKMNRPFGFHLNDRLGCCVVASAANAEETLTANGEGIWMPTDDDVQKAYSDVTGYDPSQTDANGYNPTDNGTDPVTFAKYWRKTGLGLVSSPKKPHKIGAWVQADATKPLELQLGVMMYDFVWLGVSLPNAVLPREDGTVPNWVIPDGSESDPDWQPNPDNGHMVMSATYNPRGMIVQTWNQDVLASWEFLDLCCDEPIIVLSEDILLPTGLSPAGFDLPTLRADLQRVVSQ